MAKAHHSASGIVGSRRGLGIEVLYQNDSTLQPQGTRLRHSATYKYLLLRLATGALALTLPLACLGRLDLNGQCLFF